MMQRPVCQGESGGDGRRMRQAHWLGKCFVFPLTLLAGYKTGHPSRKKNPVPLTSEGSLLEQVDEEDQLGVVVSVIRRMNEVTIHWAWLVLGWVTVFGRVYHTVCNQPTRLTQPCIPPASTSFGWGKGWNVTSAGCRQVTLCDPIWHVSSSSGEACCELLYPVTLQLTQAHLENGRQMETVTGIGNTTAQVVYLACCAASAAVAGHCLPSLRTAA